VSTDIGATRRVRRNWEFYRTLGEDVIRVCKDKGERGKFRVRREKYKGGGKSKGKDSPVFPSPGGRD